MMKGLSIGQIAQKVGVNIQTIRYYERIGLIAEPRRSGSGYRFYTEEDVEKLHFIRKAQSLGFSLKEIRSILELKNSGQRPCALVYQMAQRKLKLIEEHLKALQTLRQEIIQIVVRYIPSRTAVRGICCDLIEAAPLVSGEGIAHNVLNFQCGWFSSEGSAHIKR